MLDIYKRTPSGLQPADEVEDTSWINLTAPDKTELETLQRVVAAPPEFFTDPLDVDERARVEIDGEHTLIIVRIPYKNEGSDPIPFATLPLGIIVHRNILVTVCSRDTEIITDLIGGKTRKPASGSTGRLILQILLAAELSFIKALKQINLKTGALENELQKSMRNQELIKLLDLEKSLVYFTTSLRSNELMLERLRGSKIFAENEENLELYDDVVIETRQAIAVANIYSNILSGMMDAFASIISNNLNVVMKFLTSVTIILMLPTLVVSIYGMNVPLPFQQAPHAFLIVIGISIVLAVVGALIFTKRRFF
ncbi:MAG: magnesium transporter CorA family protein [Desulfobacterales bacterium]